MKKNTQIICTLGPASSDRRMLFKMAQRGMNVARLNFSHGDHAGHLKMIEAVRQINMTRRCHIKILQDLEGYRIRVGKFEKQKRLNKGQVLFMSREKDFGKDHIPFDFEEDVKKVEKGFDVFIDDGNIHLKVIDNVKKRLKLKVLQGGVVTERKGINIPRFKLRSNIITEKDQRDLVFGLRCGVDYVAQSFVRNKNDILKVYDIVKSKSKHCKVFAKIENEEGVRNIDEIASACDGIMVARGDLGVALPVYKIPIIQKYIIRHCNRMKKFSIVATQMLESMKSEIRPTRAEVADVSNAILDGADAVMLSAETAVGNYPGQTVMMMSKIIFHTEKHGFPSL